MPYALYKNDPNWVPPLILEEKRSLNPKKNPFFQHGKCEAWLVEDHSETVGRILAFVDHKHNEYHQEKTGFIGFFECVDSQEVADCMFDQASEWLKEEGMLVMRGPVNLSVSNECGLLITGYDHPPYLKMGHTLPFFSELFKRYSFTKAHGLLAYIMTKKAVEHNKRILSRLERVNERVLNSNQITIRSLNMKRFTEEVENVFRLYNLVMKNNWGFVPASREEIRFMAKSIRPIIDPKMIFMVEKEGDIVGCSLSIPNLNQLLPKLKGKLYPFGIFRLLFSRKQIKGLRLMLIGILPEYRERGLEVLLILNTIEKGIERGYSAAELSWISEDNKNLIGIMDKLGAHCYKTYNIYEMPLA